ncbi:MAG: pyridoxamine 5-phosphate oxidase-related FMN-binding [Ilumatobacteraceae bacterium]|nr:pyridoxamine 5-phosphate oxidase-related FMN-binding [Ilumatobacteraceae bacterium]
MQNYLHLAIGADSLKHQQDNGSLQAYRRVAQMPAADGLGSDEIQFLTGRDSLYIASVGEQGWPYVQHRGGAAGFVRVIDPTHIAWAERSGNRQYLSAGNIDHDDRISIIADDYPNRRRLKLYGHASFQTSPTAEQLSALGFEGRLEGIMTIEIVAFDWNYPKFITPRYTADEVRASVEPLHRRIAELERQLAAAG